ncbi:phosphatase PAP2 family protein [Candidatus Riesia pediculicola]|uniref:phosphatase PAP2 family protein n=1 Tax=Candidatus Riesia pediculicola TaxID=401619 RepID=UPI0009C310C8|nr:hypothetical protein AOE57_00835 [Candidatus Riesia pediculicola]
MLLLIFLAERLIFFFPIFVGIIFLLEKKRSFTHFSLIFKIIISLFTSLTLSFLLSKILYKDRPFVIGIKRNILCHRLNSSFPSMHGSACFTISFGCLFWMKNRFRTLIFLPSFFICLARVLLGVHWISDMISSFFISIFSCVITNYFCKKSYISFLIFLKKIRFFRK